MRRVPLHEHSWTSLVGNYFIGDEPHLQSAFEAMIIEPPQVSIEPFRREIASLKIRRTRIGVHAVTIYVAGVDAAELNIVFSATVSGSYFARDGFDEVARGCFVLWFQCSVLTLDFIQLIIERTYAGFHTAHHRKQLRWSQAAIAPIRNPTKSRCR